MRLIGSLTTSSDAERFRDYLLTTGVASHVEEGSDGAWQVWVEHDDHLDRATNELFAYQANPNDPKYAGASGSAKRLRAEKQKVAERRRKNYTDVRTAWHRGAAGQYATPVSAFLIGVALLATMATQFGHSEIENAQWLLERLFFQAPPLAKEGMFGSIARGEVWRLVTPMFLHFDWMHIAFNCAFMWRFGVLIESRIGSGRFALLVLVAAVLSNSAEALWAQFGPWSGGFSLFGGLSGVNYALFGYAWIKGRTAPYEKIDVSPYDVGFMLTWLVLCMLGTAVSAMSVANAAHLGGLVVGCAIGAWTPMLRKLRKRTI
jgi:GlpG protein